MDKKMPCKDSIDRLCDVLEFHLGHTKGQEACQDVIDHISDCPTCCAEIDTLAKTIEVYQSVPQCHVPADVQWRLFKELHLEIPSNDPGVKG